MSNRQRIDPQLIRAALEVSHETDPSTVVTQALQEFIGLRKQKKLLGLMSTLDWDPSYEYKLERSRSGLRGHCLGQP
jgi:hypothetical protein